MVSSTFNYRSFLSTVLNSLQLQFNYNPITDCTLSKPTLRDLRQLPVTKWYNLGLQLQVDQEELEKIQSKHPQDDRICQTKMFGVWLREVEHPNYKELLTALVAIRRRDIAESVCEKEGNTTC